MGDKLPTLKDGTRCYRSTQPCWLKRKGSRRSICIHFIHAYSILRLDWKRGLSQTLHRRKKFAVVDTWLTFTVHVVISSDLATSRTVAGAVANQRGPITPSCCCSKLPRMGVFVSNSSQAARPAGLTCHQLATMPLRTDEEDYMLVAVLSRCYWVALMRDLSQADLNF